MSTLAAGALLAAAPPASAQPVTQHVEDARLYYLRKDHLCELRLGGFIGLTKPENNPSQADLDLMREVYAVADRIIYDAQVLAKQVGPEAAKRVVDDLLPAWYAGLKHGDGQPNKAAILRADLTPGLRDCVARGQTLADRPR
ncbi:MAG: hypothetical protein KA085_07325 [Phenylobacterium sp.]|uniref:hypothetical protein n=1 Tax=Phenylobacterium sp. TaxID=1871053 RepID=UPI001B776BFD|nr:hypothetical protein [Phenylobacterium sp.]MBP7648520.1 hypothetical protein [Phenylobacterium sp.]MBP7815919.1 hypothetical protein [Phenylobacterium sp.]MBP9231126.1 hypothetical protein [Phenylobacterium sp.]